MFYSINTFYLAKDSTILDLFGGFIDLVSDFLNSIVDLLLSVSGFFINVSTFPTFLSEYIPSFISTMVVISLGIFIVNYLIGR